MSPFCSLTLFGLSSLAPPIQAQDDEILQRLERLERENAELRQAMDAVSFQLESFEFRDVIPAVGESRFGMGPAASKVYEREQGFSIGGYGEGVYRNEAGGNGDEFDFLRGVLYTGYKFDERWVFNSEIEFEHASTDKGGSVSVEFAYLEYLHSDQLNVRTGLLLTPMGFLNEMHEPTTFFGTARPETERRILPSTWRENGIGVHGECGPVAYKLYLMNGFDAEGFSASGLRGGRQKGSEAVAEDLAVAGRLDFQPTPGVVAGVSAYHGNSGQDRPGVGPVRTTIFDAHAEARWRGLRVRGLFALARVSDTVDLFAASGPNQVVVGKEMRGAYLEAGYDVLQHLDGTHLQQLIPFFRYEVVNTHSRVASSLAADPQQDETLLGFGLNWLPLDQLVFKASFYDARRGRDRFELGFGYVF